MSTESHEEIIKMLDYTKNKTHITIWNAAIEAAEQEAGKWIEVPETICDRIRMLKK